MPPTTWACRPGDTVGGFTVGHRTKMNGNPATGEIIGLCGEGAGLRVLLYFHEAQPVGVPEGVTSHRFELSFRNIQATWAELRTVQPHRKPAKHPHVRNFGAAPLVVPQGYRLVEEFTGTPQSACEHFAGEYVVLVKSAELVDRPGVFRIGVFAWTPEFSPWRHGGWYVDNVRYPSGACGCVSNSYPDKKWRIACDDRRIELGAPGDFTFPTRDAAARAELELVNFLSAVQAEGAETTLAAA